MNDAVAPATIGVYGDWGSGRSTLLRLAQERLSSQDMKDAGVICVWFNSWQFESYDDSKAALLMTAILEEPRRQRGTLEKAKAGIAAFAKRIDWMRGMGMLGKVAIRAKLALVTGGLSEVAKRAMEGELSEASAHGKRAEEYVPLQQSPNNVARVVTSHRANSLSCATDDLQLPHLEPRRVRHSSVRIGDGNSPPVDAQSNVDCHSQL